MNYVTYAIPLPNPHSILRKEYHLAQFSERLSQFPLKLFYRKLVWHWCILQYGIHACSSFLLSKNKNVVLHISFLFKIHGQGTKLQDDVQKLQFLYFSGCKNFILSYIVKSCTYSTSYIQAYFEFYDSATTKFLHFLLSHQGLVLLNFLLQ